MASKVYKALSREREERDDLVMYNHLSMTGKTRKEQLLHFMTFFRLYDKFARKRCPSVMTTLSGNAE